MSSCPGRRERILPSGRGVGGAASAACSSNPELDHARNLIVVGSGSARRPVRRAPPARRTVTALLMHLVPRFCSIGAWRREKRHRSDLRCPPTWVRRKRYVSAVDRGGDLPRPRGRGRRTGAHGRHVSTAWPRAARWFPGWAGRARRRPRYRRLERVGGHHRRPAHGVG